MGNAVQPRTLLVVGSNDVPWRNLSVRRLEHLVARPRIVVPANARRQIDRAELPLAQRILNSSLESPFLLSVADLEPELDELNSAGDDVGLDLRAQLKEAAILFLAAKIHHALHASAVIPTAIKNDDLTGCRKVLQVALHVHLTLLAV